MILTLTLNREEFAAKRRAAQDEYADALRPTIRQALEDGDWAPVLAGVETLYRMAYTDETGDTDPFVPPSGWMQQLENTLEKTKGEGKPSEDRIALWLANEVLNVAAVEASANDPEDLFLEWVTMHDDEVRAAHRHTDGQQRPRGEKFDVDGVPMERPGDSRAPIELWINCRCVLRPVLAEEALVAAGTEGDATGTCVVALPHPDHPVNEVGDVQAHVTLAWLGEYDGDLTALHEAVGLLAEQVGSPIVANISGSGVLGPDKAKVLFVESEMIEAVRGMLQENAVTGEPLRAAQTHPHFVPHMTLTYGDEMPNTDAVDTEVQFDRLAVWHGDEQTEYALGGAVTDNEDLTAAAEVKVPWFGVLAPEGVRSGDRRKFKEGSLSNRPLPLPLTWQKISDDGHKGNVTVATIEQIEMADGLMRASGFFLDTPEANEVVGLIAEFGRFGVSVDADDATFEVDEEAEEVVFTQARVSSACIVPIPAFAEAWVALGTWADQEGEGSVTEPDEDLAAAVEAAGGLEEFVDVAPGRTEDGPGWLTHPVDTDRLRDYWVRGPGAAKIAWGSPGDFDRCRANVAEYVKPQHLNGYCANRHYDALGRWPGRHAHAAETLAASADGPSEAISMTAALGHTAPAEWFQNPEFAKGDGRVRELPDGQFGVPVTVTDEGQVFGHIALWGSCHIGFSGTCTTPPHSATDYAYFKTGEVALADGGRLPVGNLTIGGGHAAPGLRAKPALAHYDSTSAVVCDVNVGEDEFGIWFAGWVRPGTSPDMVTAFQASALSGDWRKVGGNLELIAALAVNVPGFGIPRTQVAASSEGQLSLVASGIVAPTVEETKAAAEGIDLDRLAAAIAVHMRAQEVNRQKMAALAARVNGD